MSLSRTCGTLVASVLSRIESFEVLSKEPEVRDRRVAYALPVKQRDVLKQRRGSHAQ